jgi:hypothetical protein
MDPEKVNSVLAWKTLTNRDLLRGFLGAVGYLADDLAEVRIPMAALHALTGDTVPFRWEYIHQRAFYSAKLNSAQQNYPVHEMKCWLGLKLCYDIETFYKVQNLYGSRTTRV